MKRKSRSFGESAGIAPLLGGMELWSALKSDMWLRILLGVSVVLLVVTYVVIHFVLLPPEVSPPTMVFKSYSNSPSGKQYVILAITNNDSCTITFNDRGIANLEKTNCYYHIYFTLENRTLTPGSSSVGIFPVPPHPDKWIVVTAVKRHTFMERSFGWLLRTNRFVEVVESGWIPK